MVPRIQHGSSEGRQAVYIINWSAKLIVLLINKMLEVGCATGAVATDLSVLLTAVAVCVSYQLEVPATSDPKVSSMLLLSQHRPI